MDLFDSNRYIDYKYNYNVIPKKLQNQINTYFADIEKVDIKAKKYFMKISCVILFMIFHEKFKKSLKMHYYMFLEFNSNPT